MLILKIIHSLILSIFKTLSLAFLAVFFTFNMAISTQANDKVKIILDWYINPNHGPIIIAQEKGFFADEGLEVDIITPADPSDPPKLVAAGEADLAISYQAQLHMQRREGLALTRVGTLIATPLNCLLTRKQDGFTSLAGLKGKKIGYSVAGVDEMLIRAMLAPHNLSLEDVHLVNVNWSLSPALMSGQVDAVIGAYRNFELTQMRLEGVEGKCFFIEEEGVPIHDELIYVAHETKMDKAILQRFMKAVEKATAFMVNHPEASWQIFAATASELQDELNETAWFLTLPRFALRPMAFDKERYQHFDDFLKQSKMVEGDIDINAMVIDISQ